MNTIPVFDTTVGATLIRCDIDPSTCPVRRLRQNPHLPIETFMCQHEAVPKIEDKLLERTMLYRTCVTKER